MNLSPPTEYVEWVYSVFNNNKASPKDRLTAARIIMRLSNVRFCLPSDTRPPPPAVGWDANGSPVED